MDETRGKVAWLERLEQSQATWREIAAAAQSAGPDRPGANGEDWTFTDVAAHLNGWRVRTVDRLEAAARGTEPPPPPWPAELDDDTDEGVEAINRWLYEGSRGRPLGEVLAEADEQFRRMRAAVEAVPEADLQAPGRYPWLGSHPLTAVLEGSFAHLHEEHEPALRAWLAG